jgi:hypothetical protein
MTISQYKTQKCLKKYFCEIIHKIGKCNSIKTYYPEEFNDFMELFKRHSDYPNKFIGLIDIMIDYNPNFKNQFIVYIKKQNGDIDDVSILNNCITGKPKDELIIAMRNAIQPQIDEFKRNHKNICYCELCSETQYIEIDHHSEKIPFAKLYHDFMQINTISKPTSFENNVGFMKSFKNIDEEFKMNWIKYHKDHAILRFLCRKCNGSQPRYNPQNI